MEGGTDYTRRDPGQVIPTDTFVLERHPVTATCAVAREFLEDFPNTDPQLSAGPNLLGYLQDEILVSIRAHILAEKLVDKDVRVEVDVEYPATLWQHVKERLGPDWLIARRPVRYERRTGYRVISFQQYATFPASPLKTPDRLRGKYIIPFERTDVRDA